MNTRNVNLHENVEVILFKLYQISHAVWYLSQARRDDCQKSTCVFVLYQWIQAHIIIVYGLKSIYSCF